MSTSSSEEGSVMLPLHHDGTCASSGLDSTSTSSLLFSLPSDFETDITPPPSPALSFSHKAKTHTISATTMTPRDVLDASRRLGQLALQDNADVIQTPTRMRHSGWVQHRRSPCAVGDEAGYEADSDVDNDGDGEGLDRNGEDRDKDKRARVGAGASTVAETATTKLNRRPTFLRVDTRQQRRVASMLATTRRFSPSPGFPFGDTDTDADLDVDVNRETRTRRSSYTTPRRNHDTARVSSAAVHPLRAKLASLTSIRLKTNGASVSPVKTGKVESYELRRQPGPSPSRRGREPVGLGIGFPENHPLRSRAFTLPIIPAAAQDRVGPSSGDGELLGEVGIHERGSEWLPYPRSAKWKKIDAIDTNDESVTVQSDVVTLCAPNPVRLQVPVALRPTYPGNVRAREVHWSLSASQSESTGLAVRRVRAGSRRR